MSLRYPVPEVSQQGGCPLGQDGRARVPEGVTSQEQGPGYGCVGEVVGGGYHGNNYTALAFVQIMLSTSCWDVHVHCIKTITALGNGIPQVQYNYTVYVNSYPARVIYVTS